MAEPPTGDEPDVSASEAYRSEPNPWDGKVAVSRSGGRSFAYRPDRVLVSQRSWRSLDDRTEEELLGLVRGQVLSLDDRHPRAPVVITAPAADDGSWDPVDIAGRLQDEGLDARVDHVFFAVPVGQAGVGGAPVMFGGVGGAPVMFGGVGGAPVMFGGVGGTPVMFGGVGGTPVMFGGVGGCGCCCASDFGPPSGTPTPPRRSTVQKGDPLPELPRDRRPCRVVVLDTGLASDRFFPQGLKAKHLTGQKDLPDVDRNESLDSAAGHATFIAGIVERMAPGADVEVRQVLSTFGDASDDDVANALWAILDEGPPEVLNLSFAGYTDDDTAPLAVRAPLRELLRQKVVVIAAAGNDATCRPAWPASHDGVISVAALGASGPAWFTNHGPWVKACAPGVDVVSRFFTVPGETTVAEEPSKKALGDVVNWASWSGTSFAAPVVAAAVARAVLAGHQPASAATRLIDEPGLFKLPGLGTVINERPC